MTTRFAKLLALIVVLFLHLADARAGIVNAVYNSATDVPVLSAGGYDTNGLTVNFTLNFAPSAGTNLTVVKVTSPAGQVNGTFANLAQNQAVALSYGGQTYHFVANYFGGTGNDLVLQWANTKAMAWGYNGTGQLGNDTTTTSNLPLAVTASGALSGKTITSLASGYGHTLALCSDGTLAAWGMNADGQLGNNSSQQSAVPVAVYTGGALSTKRVVAVGAGAYHSLAVCSDGTVFAWGENNSGQLGNGTTAQSGLPVQVSTAGVLAGKKVVAIAAGKHFTVALLSTGAVVAWGENTSGQLGNNSTASSSLPVAVDATGIFSTTTATAIAAGDSHCLALCANGALAAWGYNGHGQLGDGTSNIGKIPKAVTIAGTALAGRTVSAIAAGAYHSLVLCADGTMAAWGDNFYGQFGNNATTSSNLAVGVTASGALLNKTITAISTGAQHSLALCSDGTLTAWGFNGNGELGTGNTTSSKVPVAVNTATLLAGERFAAAFGKPNAIHSLAIVASPAPPSALDLTTGTLISNGSFESGFANWSVSDINFPSKPLQVRDNGYNPGSGFFITAATHGNFSASSGFTGSSPGIVRLAHDVAVTAAEPFVRFDYRVGWDMLGYSAYLPPRTFALTIEPAGGGPVLQGTVILTAASGTRDLDSGVLNGALDLSAYIGTTVRVCFDLKVPEDSPGNAFFQLDNVRTAALLPASVNPITRSATAVTIEGATLNATVNASGLGTTVEFEYGLTVSYGGVITDPQSPYAGNTDAAAGAAVHGLNGNTTYHFRVKTTNTAGTKYGADATFTTLPHAPGININSLGVSGPTPSSASLYADVNPDNSSTVVTFEYGLTPDCASSTPAWESPTITVAGGFHAQISGLTGGTTYYYRVRAQNAGGVTVSNPPLTFTTPPAQPGAPAVNTLAPTMVDRSIARLQGSVNASNFALHPGPAFLLPIMHIAAAGSETFGMMYTADNFATVSDFAIGDLATAPGKGLRDPCLFRANGKWYCFCTLDAWSLGSPYPNQNQFRILTSTNLTTWTTLADITVPGATQATWAPKAFYDARSNRLYVTISSDRNPGVGAHDPKLAYASLDDLTSWSGWTTVTSLLPSPWEGFWDFQLSTDGVHYYTIGVTSGAVPSMKIYRSDTIDSGYTLFSTFDFGGGQFAEQCWLEFLGGTNWEIYYCKPQLGKIYRRTSADGMGTWSTEELIHDYSTSGKSFACPFRLPPELTPSASNGPGVSVSFEFGTTTQYTSGVGALPSTVSGGSDTPVSGTRYGLSPGTTYHYRARALGPNGYVYGPDVTFTTPAIGFPAASTDKASNITQTTALLSGFASANNGPKTTISFEYGTNTNYGATVTLPDFAASNSLAFIQTQIPVSGDGTTYHYRIRATNNIGTTYGLDRTFTTPALHEARLYDLVLNGASLFPAFDRDLTGYVVGLPFGTANLSLAPTASTGIASVTVNGITVPSGSNSEPIALNVGANAITIAVTALDGVTQRTYTITVTRAAPVAGSLDLSFNGTGIRTDNIGASCDNAYAVAIQTDGKIVVAGGSYNGNGYDFGVARYNPDGTPDMNFGTEGKATTDFAAWGDIASSVALQNDGKIIVAGSAGNGVSGDFAVVRYNANGTPDTTFNGTGKVITAFPSGGSSASSVAVQSDGKIVVAGYAQNGTDNDFALVRYHGDISTGTPGTLDTSFNGTGRVLTPLGGDDFISCMKVQANGKIVVAGYANIGGILKSALARYEVNGTLDTSFNGTGTVAMNLGTTEDAINAIAVQADGKIVTAGHANNGSNYDFAVSRFHGDIATGTPGTLDLTFNGTGKIMTALGSSDDVPTGLAVQDDGRIIVAGYSKFDAFRTDFAVVRYMGDGSLDATFHGTGKTTNDLGLGNAYAMAMGLQGDGNIVAAGYVTSGFFDDFALVRYLGDGPAIAVQVAAGPNVFAAISTVQFLGALPGASSSLTFTIQNTGTANLTGLGITIDGTDSSAFTVTSNPSAPVPTFGTTTFTVRFLPATLGPKTAALHIASNVTGHMHSYEIALTGSGLTVLENWRQQLFCSTANTGDAADDADPNRNGISNLVEYALKGDPAGNTTGTGILPQASTANSSLYGDRLQLGFTRYADRTDITLIVQGADSPAGPWSDLAINVNAGGWTYIAPGAVVLQLIDPFVDPVAIIVRVFDPYQTTNPEHPSRFMRLKVTRP